MRGVAHRYAEAGATRGAPSRIATRLFPEAGGFVDCPVYDRYRLGAGATVSGPAVIEAGKRPPCSSPGDRASVDEHGHLVIHVTRT